MLRTFLAHRSRMQWQKSLVTSRRKTLPWNPRRWNKVFLNSYIIQHIQLIASVTNFSSVYPVGCLIKHAKVVAMVAAKKKLASPKKVFQHFGCRLHTLLGNSSLGGQHCLALRDDKKPRLLHQKLRQQPYRSYAWRKRLTRGSVKFMWSLARTREKLLLKSHILLLLRYKRKRY